MTAENPGRPDSEIVGTSGMSAERAGLATASALSLPDWICPITGRMERNIMETWPPSRSAIALPLPR
jgi:hypothetical protein